MLDYRFALLGALLNAAGYVGYIISTLRGRTRPNLVSWSLWALPGIITLATQLVARVGFAVVFTFVVAFGPVAVLLATLFHCKGHWKPAAPDWWCGSLSLAALGLWVVTDNPNTAIVLAVLADSCAAVPTVMKAYRDPRSESWSAFALFAASGAVTLMSLKHWTLVNWGFPAYICAMATVILVLIVYPRKRETKLTRHQRQCEGDPDAGFGGADQPLTVASR